MKKLLLTILILLVIIPCPIVKANGDYAYFTIVALPDTQFYSFNYPQIFTIQTQWIVDNREKENIVFVTHLGDIVDNVREVYQWERAKNSLDILSKHNIPYSVVTGNHDIDQNTLLHKFPTNTFNDYFPYTDFENNDWYGGHYPKNGNENNYALVSVGSTHLLILNIGLPFTEGSANWCNSIIEAYQKRKVIAVVHGYIDLKGAKTNKTNVQGEAVWEQVIKKRDNIIMVLCGHIWGELHTKDKMGKIHNLLSNYQDRETEGAGWLRLYRFYPTLEKVEVLTYSPLLNQYEQDKNSQFEFNCSLDSSPHPVIQISNNNPSNSGLPTGKDIPFALLAFTSGMLFIVAIRSIGQRLKK